MTHSVPLFPLFPAVKKAAGGEEVKMSKWLWDRAYSMEYNSYNFKWSLITLLSLEQMINRYSRNEGE